jgi:hypothetical protein
MGLLRKVCHYGLTLTAVLILASPARANTNYVVNGGFETTSHGTGQLTFNTIATGWTNLGDGAGHDGYNFLFAPGTADTVGALGADGNLKLWGPGTGSANGLPASSPDGGNYVAADGAYEIGAIQQQISGLTIGVEYSLGYWWAGAQQSGFSGQTTEQWDVSIGDLTQDTVPVTDPSHGFTGWQRQTFTFIADSVNPLLSFLAVGTPTGEPPFSLLDGVSLQQTPEPGSFALIGLGLVAVPIVPRLRRRRN